MEITCFELTERQTRTTALLRLIRTTEESPLETEERRRSLEVEDGRQMEEQSTQLILHYHHLELSLSRVDVFDDLKMQDHSPKIK